MLIAGGCYRETCESPAWGALYGSGGRAAAAVARLSPLVELHTYRPRGREADLYPLEALGVAVHAAPSADEIAFAYFHPLSKPLIAPPPSDITPQSPLKVEGEAVLRFGFLEGDAIVNADRVVYDPQTVIGSQPFAQNGSRANTLAVVLNEGELCASVGTSDVDAAARQLISRDGAAIVIAKGGIKGARLYDAGGHRTWIPAYESPRVFKIGSGDVFSAAFSYYWGEARLEPLEAGDLASRSVACFCGSRTLPLPPSKDLPAFKAVGSIKLRSVYLAGSAATIGGRWTLEEARWCLSLLGIDVVAPALDGSNFRDAVHENYGAMLVIGDLMDGTTRATATTAAELSRSVVLLCQSSGESFSDLAGLSNVRVTDDFATAIYLAGWAAAV